MITPPTNTQSFYTAIFDNGAAKFLTALMSITGSKDVSQVIITSSDMVSDICASNELRAGADQIMSNLVVHDNEISVVSEFNPIYLPVYHGDLADLVDTDSEGSIISIAGFPNPFISHELRFSTADNINLIDAQVNFRQFVLPPIDEVLAVSKVLLS